MLKKCRGRAWPFKRIDFCSRKKKKERKKVPPQSYEPVWQLYVVISLIQIPRGEKIIAKPAQKVWWLWDGSHWQRVKARSHPSPLCSHAREERSAALPGRFPSPHGYALGLGSLHKYFKHADKSPAVAGQHYVNTWLPLLSRSWGSFPCGYPR